MNDFRLVTGILTVALLGGLALPAGAEQTFWTMNTGHIPPAHADPGGNLGEIYYYGGCGGYGGGSGYGLQRGIAAQQQPRAYGFGFAPERNPAPRQRGFPGIFAPPQYPSQLGSGLVAYGHNGSRHSGNGFGMGCGGYGYGGGNGSGAGAPVHRPHPVNPIAPPGSPPRYYPQIPFQAAVPRPMHT